MRSPTTVLLSLFYSVISTVDYCRQSCYNLLLDVGHLHVLERLVFRRLVEEEEQRATKPALNFSTPVEPDDGGAWDWGPDDLPDPIMPFDRTTVRKEPARRGVAARPDLRCCAAVTALLGTAGVVLLAVFLLVVSPPVGSDPSRLPPGSVYANRVELRAAIDLTGQQLDEAAYRSHLATFLGASALDISLVHQPVDVPVRIKWFYWSTSMCVRAAVLVTEDWWSSVVGTQPRP